MGQMNSPTLGRRPERRCALAVSQQWQEGVEPWLLVGIGGSAGSFVEDVVSGYAALHVFDMGSWCMH